MATYRIIRGPVTTAFEIFHGDGELFDAVLSDPPYGLKFMGASWDHGVPSSEVWSSMKRLLRPGANVALFGGTRTSHRLAVAVEDAGFEIRDTMLAWMYGSGWPKPADVSKYIDRKLGKERPVVGEWNSPGRGKRSPEQRFGITNDSGTITTAGSPEATRFTGYHANLKPAHEPCILARVPLDGGLANNALEHGVAGLDIDGCRVGTDARINNATGGGQHAYGTRSAHPGGEVQGRWPTNVLLTCEELLCGPGDPREIEHDPRCMVAVLNGQSGELASGAIRDGAPYRRDSTHCFGAPSGQKKGRAATAGGASRFFYTAKVSKAERGVSAHPCMKPIALCTYIARLLLPPPRADGQPRRILVPYSGSGSEMIGCLEAGWDEVIGIEYDAGCDNPGKRPDYWADVAEYRIAEHMGQLSEEHLVGDVVGERATQLGLFG